MRYYVIRDSQLIILRMTEDQALKEDTAKTEPAKGSDLPAADKKRVMLGSIIGGGMFLGILIAIIVLVSTEETKPTPVPKPKPIRRIPHHNPFIVESGSWENEKTLNLIVFNNRTAIEQDTTLPTAVPLVKNTTENEEPLRIRVLASQLDEHLLRVHYTDPQYERWEVPNYGSSEDPYAQASKYIRSPVGFNTLRKEDNRFEWAFHGKDTDILPLVTTENCRFQFFDKYIEFEARLQTDYVFGMGERIESFYLKNDNYSLWNRHYPYDVGSDPEMGMYGSHPFILNRLKDKKDFIGIFMRNSNAMLFSMWHSLHNNTYINYKMVGGVIDLYIFHAAEPDYIVKKYHSLIGRPYLPPIWAMGLQQARTGYTVQNFTNIIEKHQADRIPIDGLWADVDMNENYKTFTVNNNKFSGLKELVQKMHDPHEGVDMHFVAIANPGLKKEPGYKYYDEAMKEKCLIMSASVHDSAYEGRTMAGTTVWLDFFLHSATLVWAGGLHDLYDKSLFDGIWISENEINNICDGECNSSPVYADKRDGIPNPFHNASEFDYLQYRPTLDPLERNTLPMAAYHYGNDFFYKQFNTHNLFGLQVAKATYESLYGIFEDKRFLVASRSTWPGSGQFSSHWLADNYATWESMVASIAGILNFNMFGIPHVGAPIGGYYGDTTPELLARWFELGCFYPLMLSYSNSNTNPKEAFADPSIKNYIKIALIERYSLIRFMYTKMFEAFAWGGSVVHPLFFEFPEDEEVYKREIIDRTFMWAKTLYVVPALIPHQTRTRAYLPNWRWYDLRTREMVVDYREGHLGEYFVFDQPLGYITVLIKGGSIIPYQHMTRDAKIMNVEDLNKIPSLIIVAPDHLGRAVGSMIVDSEGIRPHPDPRSHTYRHYTFTYMNQIFRINKLAGFDFHQEFEFDYFWELIILDVFGNHHIDFACMMDMNMRKKELHYWHSSASTSLIIHDDRMAKMPMYSLESIVWGSVDQHDFCKFGVHMSNVQYENEDRVMVGELATSDPEAYQLKFDFKATALTDRIVSMQISANEPGTRQWVVPDVVEDHIRNTIRSDRKIHDIGFRTSPVHEPFYFEMSEPEDPHDFLFTTRNMPFVYVKNFIHMKFMVNSRHIFGLGERVGKFELGDGIYSIWNYDAMHEETGLPPGNNMYGSHPFYMIHLHNPHEFAGVFFLNSNPMDVKIRHVGMQTQVDHIFSGGIIDAFFIGRGTADEVLSNYHYLIGRPAPLPFWAFGYHQSRWGYRDIVHLRDVVNKFEEFNIPLDAIWMDKDYMDHYRSFTVDSKKWYGLKEFVNSLHEKGKHFVAVVDPAIAKDTHFDLYNSGLERGVYIRSAFGNKDPLVGVSWPGYSVWVDFLNPTAESFWEECLTSFYEKVPFDGIWLDMNEVSNFCDGECPDETHYNYYYFPLDYYDDLFYNPTHRPLEKGTISMEALHSGDPVLNNEFNYHSLYGFYQARTTARYFRVKHGKRPFIISSSTFPGSGRHAAHWLGDNYSSWHYMEYSISGMLNFQLFGIPFVGADICGFSGNATVNLCSRWMQLGAFYPFMRNHNGPTGSPQEPYIDAKLASVSKRAIQLRYSLARYIYTQYMHTAIRGGPMIRPVLFEFPEDNNTYSILDNSFMVGKSLRVSPILQDKVDVLETYFPNGDWYHFQGPAYKKVMSYNKTAKEGKVIQLHSSLDSENINLHLKFGSIVPRQEITEGISNILKVHDLPIELIIAPDAHLMATGELFYDTGHHTRYHEEHQDIVLDMYKNEIKVRIASGQAKMEYKNKDIQVSKITILGAKEFANAATAKYVTTDQQTVTMKGVKYDAATQILTIEAPDSPGMDISQVTSISWQQHSAHCQPVHLHFIDLF
eukprot:TRINITY_DN1495_c0_g1_i1.p1 TRINITY_DN1495_c0_g1~~TRINITY_DN1495_c0_g1_i1.p1  ORF type:complete len:1852 (+),score=191.50 TRINITY_DN1495_c0_g1_i1:15154-20709(+)